MGLLLLWVQACRKKPPVVIDEPSKIEGISDNWVLEKVEQVDVNVSSPTSASDTLLDISTPFITGAPMELVFTKDDQIYAIIPGKGTTFFPSLTGTWKFDNDRYPKKVTLDAGTAKARDFYLMQSIRPQDQFLVLKYNKFCSGKRTVSYHLWYRRK